MKALLLCAGLGTRLRPLTELLPKCLAPIGGRPLLGFWLELLARAQVGPLLVNTHYFADEVNLFVNDVAPSLRCEITLVHEAELLGTGGTLKQNRKFFGSDSFLMIHADNLSYFDPESFMRAHQNRPQGCALTMMTFFTPDPRSCGIVELDDRGVVRAFHEKVAQPPGNLANAAIYILEPEVANFVAALDGPVVDFSTQVLPHFMGRIFTFHNDAYHRDIGTVASWQSAQTEFKSFEPHFLMQSRYWQKRWPQLQLQLKELGLK